MLAINGQRRWVVPRTVQRQIKNICCVRFGRTKQNTSDTVGSRWQPESAQWRQKAARVHPTFTTLWHSWTRLPAQRLPESIFKLGVNIWSVSGRSLNYKKQTGFWQRLPKMCQDQERSTKGSASTDLQAPLAETNHKTPSPSNEGAVVSRRMASSVILYDNQAD